VFAALSRFPILTKANLRDHAQALAVAPLNTLDLVTTSGSSGQPLTVWLDRARGVREQAFIHSVWARAGFTLGDARLVLRGVQIGDVDKHAFEWEAGLRELRCSPFHLTDAYMARYAAEGERRKIAFLLGYPSALAIFARYLLRSGSEWRHTVRGVFPISEPLYPLQRAIFAEAFPAAPVMPYYGMSEKVAFAEPDYEHGEDYVFDPLYGWTEIVDDNNRPVTRLGQSGRVVATGFTSRGMPLVRYDTGDVAMLAEHPARDNGWRLRVSGLTGRWYPEFLVSSDGGLISIAALNVHSSNFLAVNEYLFVQSEVGRARLLVVPAPDASLSMVKAYADEVRAKVGRRIIFDLEIVEALGPAARGKRRYIRQELDLEAFHA
jgi:phenylacetate-CoA ligase